MLINCVAYEGGRKLADLSPERAEELAEYLERPDCFLWVALRDPAPGELEPWRRLFDLHPLAVEDAVKGQQRPKVEEYGDALFAVMRLADWVAADISLGEVAVFCGPRYVLSVRSGSKLHFLGVRERCEREPELLSQGASFVLYALMDAVVDRYFPLADAMEEELETVEGQIFARGAGRANIERLYELKHQVTTLRHAVVPLLDAMGRLYGGRVPPVCAPSTEYFRDIADHLARLQIRIDTMRETIGTAIQVNLSMVAIEDNEVTKRLAAWAGIFGVATFFVGVWGMNFEHMPELKSPWGYPAALTVIGSTCAAMYWRFRRVGWL